MTLSVGNLANLGAMTLAEALKLNINGDLPQAKDDVFNIFTGYLVVKEDVGSTVLATTSQLMGNDNGGSGKHWYGLGDAVRGQAPSVFTTSSHGAVVFASGSSVLYMPGDTFDYLAAGQVAIDTFDYSIQMGNKGAISTGTVAVLIVGVNNAAILSSDTVDLTETNAAQTAHGTLTVSDVDSPDSFRAQTNAAGHYGSFSIDTAGAWTYTMGSAHDEFVGGQVYTDSFQVLSSDGTATSVTVNMTGTNDAATITPVVANLTETNAPLTTGGTIPITDPDSPATFQYTGTTQGTYGAFTLQADGQWTWTAYSAHDEFKAGVVYTDSLQVWSADGATSTIKVNITGTNDAATFAGDTTGGVFEDSVFVANGAIRVIDPDSDPSFVVHTAANPLNGTYGNLTITADGHWSYNFTANGQAVVQNLNYGESLTDTITVTTADGSNQDIVVTIHGADDYPAGSKIVSFEDASGTTLANGYNGFNWDSSAGANQWVIDASGSTVAPLANQSPGTHWVSSANGVTSLTVSKADASEFHLYDLYMSASSGSHAVTLTGYDHGNVVGTTTVTVDSQHDASAPVSWGLIDHLTITGISGFNLGVDNLVYGA